MSAQQRGAGMRDVGFALIVLGVALLAFPLYHQLVQFVALRPIHAQLGGAFLLMAGSVSMLLTPR